MDLINFAQTVQKEKSKKEQVYEYLKKEIIFNHLEPGTVLVERQICSAGNISRTPVREAIQQLVAEGLATTLANKACVVSSITYEDIASVYEVREYIEGLAARLCAQRISESGLSDLRKYFQEMDSDLKEGNHSDLFSADFNFHECIIKNSNNEILFGFWNNLQSQVIRFTRLIDKNAAGIINSHKLHQRLLEAIENRDPNEAEAVMREHIRNSKVNHLKLFAPNIMNSTL